MGYDASTGCRVLIEQHLNDNHRGHITLRIQGLRHQELGRWLCRRIELRNGQFGHQDLVPTLDELAEWPRLPHEQRTHIDSPTEPATDPLDDWRQGATVESPSKVVSPPTFDKLPASLFPTRSKQVFVSYAWGDGSERGRQQVSIVDALCDALKGAGAQIHRDHTDMRPGDRISEFMDRLAESDHIIVVVSDKYLRSENCMYELFRIYRNCADDPSRFVRRVIPLMLPDALLDTIPQRLARAKYWVEQWKMLTPEIEHNFDAVGIEVFKKYRLIAEFARNTSDMLEHLSDILQPRDFEQMAKDEFRQILVQIT